MDHPETEPQHWGHEYWAWFGFWAQFVVLGGLAILGLVVAGSDAAPGDGTTGLVLAVVAVALAFMRLKHSFDGNVGSWVEFLLVDRPSNLVVVIPLFTVIALAGLFIAAGSEGSLRSAGIGLFVASGIAVFLNLKRVFDALDTHR
jgi:hypothetical protein